MHASNRKNLVVFDIYHFFVRAKFFRTFKIKVFREIRNKLR